MYYSYLNYHASAPSARIVLCMGGAWCYIPTGWLLLAKPFLVPIYSSPGNPRVSTSGKHLHSY